MTHEITFWQWVEVFVIACYTLGFIFILSLVSVHINRSDIKAIKQFFFDWAVSIGSKVKSLSERLKSRLNEWKEAHHVN